MGTDAVRQALLLIGLCSGCLAGMSRVGDSSLETQLLGMRLEVMFGRKQSEALALATRHYRDRNDRIKIAALLVMAELAKRSKYMRLGLLAATFSLNGASKEVVVASLQIFKELAQQGQFCDESIEFLVAAFAMNKAAIDVMIARVIWHLLTRDVASDSLVELLSRLKIRYSARSTNVCSYLVEVLGLARQKGLRV